VNIIQKIFISLLILLLTSSCQNNAAVLNEECKDSIVYKNIPNAGIISSVLVIQGLDEFKKMKQAGLDPLPILYALYKINSQLDEPELNYLDYVTSMTALSFYVYQYSGGVQIQLTDIVLNAIKNTNQIVNKCDREFFRKLTNHLILAFNMV
jgi:hypothetical protein